MAKRIIVLVLTLGIAFFNAVGVMDTPAMVKGIIQDMVINPLTDPHRMDLRVNGVIPERMTSFFGLIYDGYEVKVIVLNSGSSGYATIRCEAYDNNRQLHYYSYQFPHIKRNEQITVTCRFKDIPDSLYQFKADIISQTMDS